MLERMWSKRKSPSFLVGMQTCTTTLKISMVVSQKTRNQSTSGPSNTTLEHIPKGNLIILQERLFNYVHSSIFIIVRTWKQPRCPSTKEWVKKMWYIYTMEHYLAVKKKWQVEICMQMDGTRKKHSEWGNPDSERWAWYVLTHKWVPAVKQRITSL